MRKIKWVYPGEILRIITPNGTVEIFVGEKDSKGRIIDTILLIPDRFPKEQKVNVKRNDNKFIKNGQVNLEMVRLKTVKVED